MIVIDPRTTDKGQTETPVITNQATTLETVAGHDEAAYDAKDRIRRSLSTESEDAASDGDCAEDPRPDGTVCETPARRRRRLRRQEAEMEDGVIASFLFYLAGFFYWF
ncbi:hypothetical protein EsH8_I_000987 [Colletotrichum jinshuiense]